MQYVDVIVNKTRIYTYASPENLNLTIGRKVLVPLRQKDQEGYVISTFTEKPDFKVLAVKEAVDENIYFSAELVELAEWVSAHYKCFLPTALKVMLL